MGSPAGRDPSDGENVSAAGSRFFDHARVSSRSWGDVVPTLNSSRLFFSHGLIVRAMCLMLPARQGTDTNPRWQDRFC